MTQLVEALNTAKVGQALLFDQRAGLNQVVLVLVIEQFLERTLEVEYFVLNEFALNENKQQVHGEDDVVIGEQEGLNDLFEHEGEEVDLDLLDQTVLLQLQQITLLNFSLEILQQLLLRSPALLELDFLQIEPEHSPNLGFISHLDLLLFSQQNRQMMSEDVVALLPKNSLSEAKASNQYVPYLVQLLLILVLQVLDEILL